MNNNRPPAFTRRKGLRARALYLTEAPMFTRTHGDPAINEVARGCMYSHQGKAEDDRRMIADMSCQSCGYVEHAPDCPTKQDLQPMTRRTLDACGELFGAAPYEGEGDESLRARLGDLLRAPPSEPVREPMIADGVEAGHVEYYPGGGARTMREIVRGRFEEWKALGYVGGGESQPAASTPTEVDGTRAWLSDTRRARKESQATASALSEGERKPDDAWPCIVTCEGWAASHAIAAVRAAFAESIGTSIAGLSERYGPCCVRADYSESRGTSIEVDPRLLADARGTVRVDASVLGDGYVMVEYEAGRPRGED